MQAALGQITGELQALTQQLQNEVPPPINTGTGQGAEGEPLEMHGAHTRSVERRPG